MVMKGAWRAMPQNIRPGGMGPEHSMRSSSEDEEAIRRGKKRKRDERDESEGDRDRPGQSTKSRGPLREITNESRTVPSESPPVSEKPVLYGLERAFRDNLPDNLTEDRHLNGQQQEEAFKVIQRTMQLIRSYEHQGKDSTELRKA